MGRIMVSHLLGATPLSILITSGLLPPIKAEVMLSTALFGVFVCWPVGLLAQTQTTLMNVDKYA